MSHVLQLAAIGATGVFCAAVVLKGWHSALAANFVLSGFGFLACLRVIPASTRLLIDAGCFGKDLLKKDQPTIPESLGLIVAAVYLMIMFVFIPFPYEELLDSTKEFPHNEFVELVCGLLSICCMTMLGFADDVLNLKWRYKLVLPTIATLPLLMVYHVNEGSTTILLPNFCHGLAETITLGPLYYIYLSMLGVFCTNAINILAGVNGIESGQSLIIGVSIMIHSIADLWLNGSDTHQLSIFFITPFVATTAALCYYNWFPCTAFVGDTFCYFAGMTFAVVGILGRCKMTVLLFFIPQILNFLYSVPQLFRFIPCPRHRMPRLNEESGNLKNSVCVFKPTELKSLGKILFAIIKLLRLAKISENAKDGTVTMSNLTLINYVIYIFGERREDKVCTILLVIQILSSCMAFYIRYSIVPMFY